MQPRPLPFQSTRPVRDATHPSRTSISPCPFQSTRPVRDATRLPSIPDHLVLISIHAPRTGRDHSCLAAPCGGADFNPRAPYGTRQRTASTRWPMALFQSTRPVRDATRLSRMPGAMRKISIHAPRTGRDVEPKGQGASHGHFNPRAPYGTRQ